MNRQFDPNSAGYYPTRKATPALTLVVYYAAALVAAVAALYGHPGWGAFCLASAIWMRIAVDRGDLT